MKHTGKPFSSKFNFHISSNCFVFSSPYAQPHLDIGAQNRLELANPLQQQVLWRKTAVSGIALFSPESTTRHARPQTVEWHWPPCATGSASAATVLPRSERLRLRTTRQAERLTREVRDQLFRSHRIARSTTANRSLGRVALETSKWCATGFASAALMQRQNAGRRPKSIRSSGNNFFPNRRGNLGNCAE